MGNKKFWLGILVMVLVFGMMVVGCDDGSTGGSNTENTGGNNPGSTQSFSFPSQLKNTTWLKDGTTAGYTSVWISFYTDSFAFSFRNTDGSMKYESRVYVDSVTSNTYHMKSGGTFTATVSGNKLTTTSSSWGSSVIGTFTKQ
jgi:hypothetical protein